MRTRDLKHLAEQSEEEYAEYVEECNDAGSEPTDIWTWLAEQQATAEEAHNDYLRDEGLDKWYQ